MPRRISIRTLLVVITCLAGIVAYVALPIANARRVCRCTLLLSTSGAEISTHTFTDEMYRYLKLPVDEAQEFSNTLEQIPDWQRRLAGVGLETPMDVEIREVSISTERQLVHLVNHAADMPNVHTLVIHGENIGPGVFQQFVESFAKFTALTTLELRDTQLSENCLSRFAGLRCLRLATFGSPKLTLTSTQLGEIGLMPNLQVLGIHNYNIGDDRVSLLSPNKYLRHITLWQTGITYEGEMAYSAIRPDCEIDVN